MDNENEKQEEQKNSQEDTTTTQKTLTQEEVNAIVTERLKRERERAEKDKAQAIREVSKTLEERVRELEANSKLSVLRNTALSEMLKRNLQDTRLLELVAIDMSDTEESVVKKIELMEEILGAVKTKSSQNKTSTTTSVTDASAGQRLDTPETTLTQAEVEHCLRYNLDPKLFLRKKIEGMAKKGS